MSFEKWNQFVKETLEANQEALAQLRGTPDPEEDEEIDDDFSIDWEKDN